MENSVEKRVFVFGSGIISKLLIKILSDNGYEVINITRPTNKSKRLFALSPNNYEWIARFGNDLKESMPSLLLKKMKLIFGSHDNQISIDAENNFMDALAYMVSEDCIEKSVESLNLDVLEVDHDDCELSYEDGIVILKSSNRTFKATLCFFTERGFRHQSIFDYEFLSKSYNQTAISFFCETSNLDSNTAIQIFDHDSILAILPFDNNHGSIVWSCNQDLYEKYQQLNEDQLSDDLNERLKGHASVKIKKLKIESFPLQKRVAKDFYNQCSILIGDAAHVIHPMAGQGLNLGLRDLRELEILLKKRKSNNLGIESFLAKYNRHRKRDVVELMYLTDSLYEFFPGSLGGNRTWMDKALKMFEKSDAVKTFFMDRAIQ
jgi:hypothetical protein